jgi:hypothetical protein
VKKELKTIANDVFRSRNAMELLEKSYKLTSEDNPIIEEIKDLLVIVENKIKLLAKEL